mmetsp:Transcript_46758/g.54645  ORF Transcript_46758/g.54645 Transcript_46758/m.54645 type:complete len:103 (+) Transcript_46758:118-426(+)
MYQRHIMFHRHHLLSSLVSCLSALKFMFFFPMLPLAATGAVNHQSTRAAQQSFSFLWEIFFTITTFEEFAVSSMSFNHGVLDLHTILCYVFIGGLVSLPRTS